MHSKRKAIIKESHFKKYSKDYLKLMGVLLLLIYFFKKPLIYSPVLSFFKVENTVGYVVNEKSYERRGHLTNEFTYYYEFKYDNTIYSNVSNVKNLKVGDSLPIEFNRYFPFINRIKANK